MKQKEKIVRAIRYKTLSFGAKEWSDVIHTYCMGDTVHEVLKEMIDLALTCKDIEILKVDVLNSKIENESKRN